MYADTLVSSTANFLKIRIMFIYHVLLIKDITYNCIYISDFLRVITNVEDSHDSCNKL